MNIEGQVRELLFEILENEKVKVIDKNTNLVEVGLNSLAYIQLVVRLEETYDIVIPDDRLSIEEVNTISTICSIIYSLGNENKTNDN